MYLYVVLVVVGGVLVTLPLYTFPAAWGGSARGPSSGQSGEIHGLISCPRASYYPNGKGVYLHDEENA